jgi:hypothetical protein
MANQQAQDGIQVREAAVDKEMHRGRVTITKSGNYCRLCYKKKPKELPAKQKRLNTAAQIHLDNAHLAKQNLLSIMSQ